MHEHMYQTAVFSCFPDACHVMMLARPTPVLKSCAGALRSWDLPIQRFDMGSRCIYTADAEDEGCAVTSHFGRSCVVH